MRERDQVLVPHLLLFWTIDFIDCELDNDRASRFFHSPTACSLSGEVPSGVGHVTAIPGVGTDNAGLSPDDAVLTENKPNKPTC